MAVMANNYLGLSIKKPEHGWLLEGMQDYIEHKEIIHKPPQLFKFPLPFYESIEYETLKRTKLACEGILVEGYNAFHSSIELKKGSEEIIPKKESTEAIKKIMKQDFALSMSEMAIGLALMITGAIIAYIPLAIIGFGSAGLGFLHLAWTTKPKK